MNGNDKSNLVSLSFFTLWKVVLVVAVVYFVYYLRDIFLVLLTSIVLGSAIRPFSTWFEKFKIPRILAVLLVYIIGFSVILGTLYFIIPPIFGDMLDIAQTLPAKMNSFMKSSGAWSSVSGFSTSFVDDFSINDLMNSNVSSFLPAIPKNVMELITFLFNGVFSFVLIIIISFYIAVQKNGVEEFLRLIVPLRSEAYALDLWQRVEKKIGGWLQGQILLGVIIGPLVFLGLSLLGVKYALILAILAAVFELIPFFGPVLSAVPAVIFAFSIGAPVGLMTLGFYVVVQQFENHLIYPLVVRKIIGVPPLIVIISLVVGAKLAGFLGIILAVPMATLFMEMANDMETRKGLFRLQSTRTENHEN
ncbi:MAG: hypothetical protein A2556_01095 [Candidatus Vogelbacteria bacterium RIFOXYD2_FULL_44_9]|uniref:AI-2E family transporter n=1 Tax=Candidatus Vogelbacteria bacterium RIFOXYD2_FULL_44_9 TaxID=1802441 RepID=A0A1G2QN40_9BACT|nr:MAG: hypothetical protein A2556_01095 [Candidatus Vogelbacteria bacterium RIFOXYD2_FULL_44_9]